jgi:uncharacterized protein
VVASSLSLVVVRVWLTAEEPDMSVGLHEGGNGGRLQVRMEGGAPYHHPHDGNDAGVHGRDRGQCVRASPEDPIAFVEPGGGWIAGWLDRMDWHFDDEGLNCSDLITRPSELFKRYRWIAFEPVERCLARWSTTLGGTRFYGPSTTRIQTASFQARRQWCASGGHQPGDGGGAKGFYGLH